MSAHAKLISDYIDGYLSEKETSLFLLKMLKDKSLKSDLVLMQDINSYMKGKLLSENIKYEIDFPLVEIEAREDVIRFTEEGKNDKEILNYLSIAFPDRSEKVKNQIQEAEKEISEGKVDYINEEYLNKLSAEKNKDDAVLLLLSRSQIKEKEEQPETHKITPYFKKHAFKYAAVAASVALLLLFNYFRNQKSPNEKIFAEYHPQAEKISGNLTRSAEYAETITFEQAVKLYNSENYDAAYKKFKQTADKNPEFVQANYYAGLALFEAGRYAESVDIFKHILTSSDLYRLETEWYLSLAYIKLNKMQKALPCLKDIASQKNLRQTKAREIIKKIKN